MPAHDRTRWKQNPDGSWSRIKPGEVPLPAETSAAGAEAIAEVAAAGQDPDGYWSMTKAELEEELSSRDLPKYGNKDELIARLEEADAA